MSLLFNEPATGLKSPRITNSQRTVVVNLRQDFVANTHYAFFQGQLDRGLIYRPNHSGKLECTNKKKMKNGPFDKNSHG